MENNIPTAKELFDKMLSNNDEVTSTEMMVEFAKLHVQAALKEALDSIPCLGSSSDIPTYEEVENAVLNAYPLDKIK
jgi:hypothetical protein